MRKLTGLLSVLLLALAAGPVVASTSDSATNDYTATVNTDVDIVFTDASSVTDDAGVTFTSSDYGGAGNGSVTLDISPTATDDSNGEISGDDAAVTITPHLEISSNSTFDLSVTAQSSSSDATFYDPNASASTGYAFSNMAIQQHDDMGNTDVIQFASDSDGDGIVTETYPNLGSMKVEDFQLDTTYALAAPDDLTPGTYQAQLEYKVVPN